MPQSIEADSVREYDDHITIRIERHPNGRWAIKTLNEDGGPRYIDLIDLLDFLKDQPEILAEAGLVTQSPAESPQTASASQQAAHSGTKSTD